MNKIKFTSLSLLLVGVLTLTSCSSWGVPGAAKDALRRDFPNAQRIEWDKQDNGLFEVEFFNAGIKTKVLYSPEGTAEFVEETLRFTLLPEAVKKQVRQYFPAQEIEDIYRRTDAEGNVRYAVEIGDVERLFGEDGRYIGPFDALAPQVVPAPLDTALSVVDTTRI